VSPSVRPARCRTENAERAPEARWRGLADLATVI
jgi:hypothetical protein